jgi:uncharacterized protein YceH (UPF0502 family)
MPAHQAVLLTLPLPTAIVFPGRTAIPVRCLNLSPLFLTLTKTPGVWSYSSHSGKIRASFGDGNSLHYSSSFFSFSCALFCAFLHSLKTQLFCFQAIPHSLPKTRGVGVGSCFHHSPLTIHQSPNVVSFHPVNIFLHEVECRVLGSLIEKEITTPEYYPLSLNALVNACNQKSNRDPVMNLDEAAVRQALHSLDGQSLVRSVSASDSRVTKYEHRLQEAFNFYRHEIAILCVLLLRGPQTAGELRTRAERMHTFDDLSAVQSSLQHLMKREPPLVKVLPRQPGTKEARYTHLLAGDVEVVGAKLPAEPQPALALADREGNARLEKEVAALRQEVAGFQKEIAELRQQFAQFKKQFE